MTTTILRASLAPAFLALAVLPASNGVAPAQGVPLPPIGQAAGPPASRNGPLLPAPARKMDGASRDAPTLPPPRQLVSPEPATSGYDLHGLTVLMLQRNPRLAQAAYAIDAAAGRAVQAGLYPNPVVSIMADELADRTGPAGIIAAPQISQEIVTAGKLKLSRAAADKEIDQAALELLSLRYGRFGAVRQAYYEVLTLQRRLRVLDGWFRLAEQAFATSETLRKAGQASRLDLTQLEVERERFRVDREATLRELPAAFRRLAAAVGVNDLPNLSLAGSLDAPLPDYDLEKAREFVTRAHPDVVWARKGVKRAELLLERARVEPIPNVTVQAAFVRQNQNKSNDFNLGVSLPVPVWNKNQGNIAAAQAQLGEAIQQVGRAENELVDRLALAFGTYASARRRAELYRSSIVPPAREGYQLALKAYRAAESDYLRVLEAQRLYSQADLEYIRSLGEAWRAAGEISGLLLEEQWPCPPQPAPAQLPPPQVLPPAGKDSK